MLTLNGTAGEIIERAEIQLQCSLSQGWPRPMLVWLRDDVELSNSSQLQIDDDISMTSAGLYVASSILYIPSSLPGDSGTYTCRPDLDIPDTTITPMSVFINVIMRGMPILCVYHSGVWTASATYMSMFLFFSRTCHHHRSSPKYYYK